MAVKYRVKMMESERGWGKKYWNEDFDTYEQAHAYMERVNKSNQEDWERTKTVPDYYMQPDSDIIEAVKV